MDFPEVVIANVQQWQKAMRMVSNGYDGLMTAVRRVHAAMQQTPWHPAKIAGSYGTYLFIKGKQT
ncbi:hypothetical protein HAV22_23645 [Massilia sp. TW-1]|uniref:Uncharacterized protein n=1 Tax=Telluria antibiotica TaxID=2717319 RepID=A0ABX0PHI1_9BURK|nr:hypothetical protein [Telluria antibiotica]NIA56622.1 hypothetical protein [Telluria antibiotica]